jgi:hypothetical protein
MNELDYIVATDLAKLRIIKIILNDLTIIAPLQVARKSVSDRIDVLEKRMLNDEGESCNAIK